MLWELIDEPNNAHDKDAVCVHLNGSRVGYIPRRLNTIFRETTHCIEDATIQFANKELRIAVRLSEHASDDARGDSPRAKRARRE